MCEWAVMVSLRLMDSVRLEARHMPQSAACKDGKLQIGNNDRHIPVQQYLILRSKLTSPLGRNLRNVSSLAFGNPVDLRLLQVPLFRTYLVPCRQHILEAICSMVCQAPWSKHECHSLSDAFIALLKLLLPYTNNQSCRLRTSLSLVRQST